MDHPNKDHWFTDRGLGIRFNVRAYRQLTDEEALRVIKTYLRNTPRKKLQSGIDITIKTLIR